ncbi:MAG: hypothetical protein Q8R30_02220 [bacterium]|nr:hypothetical protein [bacterium]MDZ4285781.1 hypothetical protein [Candidatus Sungbacteria bacterium]
MNTAIINIKTDPKLKKELKKVTKKLGLPLGTIINAYLRGLVQEQRVVFSVPPTLNQRAKKLLERIDRDIHKEKNADGPFSLDEALAYLDRSSSKPFDKSLKELVAMMRPENMHKETDWGMPVGKEIW